MESQRSGAAIDDPVNRIPRQLLLWQEPRRRAFGDRSREIGRRMGRDQDHGRLANAVACGQTPGKLKPALTPEHDVHQDNLRLELLCSPQRLSRGSGNADDAQALPFQAIARGHQKQPVVVHDQDTKRCHVNSIPACKVPRIGASTNRKSRALTADSVPGNCGSNGVSGSIMPSLGLGGRGP
jgi:hypothetical protein